jgi:hypothetical protein
MNIKNNFMKKEIFLLSLVFFFIISCFSQETYKIGETEYYYNKYYSTTGKPMVKRSETNKSDFLKSKGYNKVPDGYEVDHIVPLSEGGTDDPMNMQLITKEQHASKTANEASKRSNSTFNNYPKYNTNATYKSTNIYSSPTNTNDKTIYTGPKGGQYYINNNGNKTYINSNNSSSYSTPKYNSTSTFKNYSSPKVIHTGPRGGNYYINSKGNKTYIKK